MLPVTQTRWGKDDGNCLEACIASILELPLNEVPDCEGSIVGRGALHVLRANGFLPVVVGPDNDVFECGGHHPYGIGIVESTGGYHHAVVFERRGLAWFPVWDPDHHAPKDPRYTVLAIAVLLIR